MRWIWIDKFIEFTPRQSATAVKNITLAEEHLSDLYPDFPIVPHSLIVEGMAQTAGILVGEARQFQEKVILAKIGRTFHRLVRPGDTILYRAKIEQLSEHGASINGTVTLAPAASICASPPIAKAQPAGFRLASESPDHSDLVAEIELMFSHIDKNLSGIRFPEHNFVFSGQFTHLLESYRTDAAIRI